MKKFISLLLALVFVLSIIPVFAQDTAGRLELIKGTVIYQLPGQTTWNPLTSKSVDLVVGTVIQTKENSQAILKFEDGSRVLIGEMTLFKVQTKTEKDKKNLFTIRLFGKTFVEVKKTGAQNNFKIQTPTALATIRGSKMLVEVGNNLLTRVTSSEGIIDVASTYLFKGTVLYVEGNLITLETSEGIKKVSISKDTIIPERGGSTTIRPNDRIAIYAEEAGASEAYYSENTIASLTTLPAKNMIAQFAAPTAGLVTWTNYPNVVTQAQATSLTVGAKYFIPTAPQMPVAVPPLTTTVVAPSAEPLPPAPLKIPPPTDVGQASSQQTQQSAAGQSTGKPAGEQASTSTAEPSSTAAPTPTVSTSTPATTTNVPPLISPTSTTGTVQFTVD